MAETANTVAPAVRPYLAEAAQSKRFAAVCAFLLSAFCFVVSAFGQHAIDWYTIDGGGGQSTDGYHTITGTIGQPDAGILSDGYYTILGGFWGILAAVPAPGMPGLTIERTPTNSVIVSWPASWVEWHLQQCPDLRAEYWTDVPTAAQAVAGRMQVVMAPPLGSRFYRLSTEPSRPPTLTVTLTATNSVLITWPVSVDTWQLQACTDLGVADWVNVAIPPVQVGGHWQVVVYPIPGIRYYRLVQVTGPASPSLSIVLTDTNSVVISWPLPATGWVLEATTNLETTGSIWTDIPSPYQTNGPNLQFIEPAPSGNRFYRLHKP